MYGLKTATRQRARAGTDESGEPHAWFRASFGRASNNVAEYEGLKTGMRRATRAGDTSVIFEVDSYVVAKHMAHRNAWACKTKALKEHYKTCRALGQELTEKGVKWEVRHIYREFNQTADGRTGKCGPRRRKRKRTIQTLV